MGQEGSGKPRRLGRYALYDEIASGGMAAVHFGRLLGPVGFSRTVAIKRLHQQHAKDPEFVSMFLDEAHLAARIRHPNVVPTLDVVATGGELFLVMEYVQGEALSKLLSALRTRKERIPLRVVASIVSGVLQGLHAAHEATDERGLPLGIVHRDVSPQNVLVGKDGLARVLDFGIAKAAVRLSTTRGGQIKGKLAYMPPEQIQTTEVSAKADIYAAGVVLWEALAGTRLFKAETEAMVLARILAGEIAPPSRVAPEVPAAYDAVVLKALARRPDDRYRTAREMALALERCGPVASPVDVAEWLQTVAGDTLRERATTVTKIESDTSVATDVAEVLEKIALSEHLQSAPPAAQTSSPSMPTRVHAEPPPRSVSSASQLSSVSVSADIRKPASRGVLVKIVATVGVVIGLVMIGFAMRSTVASSATAGGTAPATTPAAPPTASAAAGRPGSTPVPLAVATEAVPPPVGSSAPAPAEPSATSSSSVVASPPGAGRAPAPPPAVRKPASNKGSGPPRNIFDQIGDRN